MEDAFVQYVLSQLPKISEGAREKLRKALGVNFESVGQELRFDDARRTIRWDRGHCVFSAKAVLRYRLVKELYESETGQLSAAEIGERLYDDDMKDWDAIRVLGSSTENTNLEPANFPYMLEAEKQGLKILKRCEAITLRKSST